MRSEKWFIAVRRLVCLTAVCVAILSLTVNAADERKVRVGLYNEEGYHAVDENGNHRGYDYEYLMEIAGYTGWSYEYVEGSWQECVDMLKRGEIDLLGGVEMSAEREEKLGFASTPSMYGANCLLTLAGSDTYAYEDFKGFDGMRIGLMEGSSLENSLDNYSVANHFTYTGKWYSTEEELQEALAKKEIDAVFLSDNRILKGYELIASFDYTPFYYATSEQRKDLLGPLNNALEQIHTQNHYYESELYTKYFNSSVNIALTKAEEEFIRRSGLVKVALVPGFPVFYEYNDREQKCSGIIIDALVLISQRTGLQFQLVNMPADVYPEDYMAENPDVIIAPYFLNSLISYGSNVSFLDPIVKGRMVGVCRAGEYFEATDEFALALPGAMTGVEAKIRKLFPNATLVTGETHRDGLEMVRNGFADVTLLNEISASYMLESPYYSALQPMNIEDITEDLSLGLSSSADSRLVSILNKGIASLSERDIRQIVVDNTVSHAYEMNFGEWLFKYRLEILLFSVVILGLLFIIYSEAMQKKRKEEDNKRLMLAEERHKADLEYQKKMFRQANFDALTGLYNKTYFVEKTNELMQANPDTTYTFFQLDINKFKMINELYGPERGDMVLQKIADKLRDEVGDRGIYGRIYADQFIVCYPADEEKMSKIPEGNVLHLECDGQSIRVQMNVGVYINTKHFMDAGRVIEYTQIALQHRDKTEDTHIHYYQDNYLDTLMKNQRITNEMENALKEGQFRIFLQPQYEIVSRKLVGAEALVRWFHPKEGVIPPNEFIPVFEGNRFIYKLDMYVCEQVCKLLAKWKRQGKLIPVSINLSRYDLQNPELIHTLQSMLDRYGVPVSYLHLEITESAYVKNHKELTRIIEELRALGFFIEMDDFGSGYSSLNMLKDIPVDVLKLDMRFFDGETHMDRGGNIIESVVKLAHSFGMVVIAEGVETEREANFLRSIQCHVVQGYLYGRPMAVEEFEKSLAESVAGQKMVPVDAENDYSNLYWKAEKYNLLLRYTNSIVFDYDPTCDFALMTYIGKNGKLNEKAIVHYTADIRENDLIHPDDREKLKDGLQKMGTEQAEFDYQADYYETGEYESFHALTYGYFREDKLNRVIAIITKK